MDIAVTFCRGFLGVTELTSAAAFRLSLADPLYLVIGEPSRLSGDLAYFAFWAQGPFDLCELARDLSSRRGPVCVVWKSHGGQVGGYSAYVDGRAGESRQTADRAWTLPPHGVEQTFGALLKIRQRDRMCFPEFLIDERLACYRWRGAPTERTPELTPGATITELLNGSGKVKPVFPFSPIP